MPQGGRNSGRVVATTSSGASAPRSAMQRSTSSVVGSAQCKSSNASTTGWALAPAITQLVSAANCRRRNSSGGKAGARSLGSGMSNIGGRMIVALKAQAMICQAASNQDEHSPAAPPGTAHSR